MATVTTTIRDTTTGTIHEATLIGHMRDATGVIGNWWHAKECYIQKQKKPRHKGKASPVPSSFPLIGFAHHKAQSGQMSGYIEQLVRKSSVVADGSQSDLVSHMRQEG